jgi:hypothetical protein
MSKTNSIPVNLLREMFFYNHLTGQFFYRTNVGDKIKAGSVAGGPNGGGYWCIQVNRKKYKAHRMAWAYANGVWPDGKIDHINGDGLDNRIANLRCVTHAQNHQNRRTPNKNTKVGLLGVDFKKDKFRARITINGKQHDLGRFDTAEDAHAAYLKKKRELHPYGTL